MSSPSTTPPPIPNQTSQVKPFFSKTFISLLSLGLTILVLFFLSVNIEKIGSGDRSPQTILATIVLSLTLFILPFFFTRSRTAQPPPVPTERDKKNLKIRLIKRINLNRNFTGKSGILCPLCHHLNPAGVRICMNCGSKLP